LDRQAALTIGVLAAMVASCNQSPQPLPPHGQVIVVVDTDLPAPNIASHFRADFYAADGTWYDSRSLAVPDESVWPLSFGLANEDDTTDKLVFVRLRVYPEGRERDYRGERYEDSTRSLGTLPAPVMTDASTGAPPAPNPRLVRQDADGGDQTPSSEPLPRLTVDRLLLVRVRPGVVTRTTVVLRGACAGTMARLATESYVGPNLDQARTCVDTPNEQAPLTEAVVDSDVDAAPPSVVGTFGADAPCTKTPVDPSYACVPSGAFVFGGERFGDVNVESSAPDRVVRVSSFVIDRDEVTVKQYRDAIASGLPPPTDLTRDYFQPQNGSACTYTSAPSPKWDDVAVTCVGWTAARAYCRFRGGDLPTEAQWEWAATGGRSFKPRFPWGDEPPSCDAVAFGRAYVDNPGFGPFDWSCNPPPQKLSLSGPGSAPSSAMDVSAFLVRGMGGGSAEWTLDEAKPFTDLCWTLASPIDPRCAVEGWSLHTLRGGSWRSGAKDVDTLTRFFANDYPDFTGFRCVYSAPPGGWQ
jgi:formylglycine-generating enzyme required for sulfatase activity